jgi:hypothetical protein
MEFLVLKNFADYIVINLLTLKPGSHPGESLDYFIYESIKIDLLLAVIIFLVAIIPIVHALTEKWMDAGTALAFLMAVTTLSLRKVVMLKNVMKNPMSAVFFGTVAVSVD